VGSLPLAEMQSRSSLFLHRFPSFEFLPETNVAPRQFLSAR